MKDCEFTILYQRDFKIVLETRYHHARLDFGTKHRNVLFDGFSVLISNNGL
jgi:hypothetical protein